MGDLSKHFNRNEIECTCGCGQDTIDYKLIVILEKVRVHFNKPVTVTSGCRCIIHNKSVGGVDTSFHTIGRAADIQVRGVAPIDVYNYISKEFPNSLGLGSYKVFTHVDTRNYKARW